MADPLTMLINYWQVLEQVFWSALTLLEIKAYLKKKTTTH